MARGYVLLGDNWEWMRKPALSSLNDKVDVIYLDPPYNTGTVKSYNDKFTEYAYGSMADYSANFAFNLLKSTGVAFVSCDDSSIGYWRNVLNSRFGAFNNVGLFITHQSQRSNAKHINTVHEYILCYAKDKRKLPEFKVPRIQIAEQNQVITRLTRWVESMCDTNDDSYDTAREDIASEVASIVERSGQTWLGNYVNIDDDGRVFSAGDLSVPGNPRFVDIPEIGLKLEPLERRGWVSDKMFKELAAQNRLYYRNGRPYKKNYLDESYDSAPSILPFYSRQGSEDLKRLGLTGLFDTAKPVELVKFLIRLACPRDGLVMDWFAGSGTTGQAVVELNKELGSSLRYILMQSKEKVSSKASEVLAACKKYEVEPFISHILLRRLQEVYRQHALSVGDIIVVDESDYRLYEKTLSEALV